MLHFGRTPVVFGVLLQLLRNSSNFKIRIQAAAALAVPMSMQGILFLVSPKYRYLLVAKLLFLEIYLISSRQYIYNCMISFLPINIRGGGGGGITCLLHSS